MKSTSKNIFYLIIVILGLAILASFSFFNYSWIVYRVDSDQMGVERLFGKYWRTTKPGLHFTLPYPIVKVDIVPTTMVRKVEIGFKTDDDGNKVHIPEEALMLTGDENIVDLEVVIQYQVSEPEKYLFNAKDIDKIIKNSCMAAVRNVIGHHTIDEALTTGKALIQESIYNKIKEIWSYYDLGLHLLSVQLQLVSPPPAVSEAFKDVVNAREDKNTYINEAIAYKEKTIPEAKAKAYKIIQDAISYKIEKETKAQGETKRFLTLLEKYNKNPNITETKLFYEVINKVLPKAKVYIIDSKSGGTLNLLNLDKLNK